jgi:hypothetical protein
MAKQYVVNFSTSEEIVEFSDNKMSIRSLEIKLLNNLFQIALDSQTKISKAFECKDCMSALDNLSDEDAYIEFTNDDLAYAIAAFEKTAEKRPGWWFDKCSQIFEQITNPKEK